MLKQQLQQTGMSANKNQKKEETNLKKVIGLIIILLFLIIVINLNGIKMFLYNLEYKTKYSEYVEKYAKEYSVDKNLIYAIIKSESNFKEKAKSKKGAIGLMQLMYTTAEEIAEKLNIEVTEENIIDPQININIGTKYISILIQKYQNINLALAAYNAGSGNVDSWINSGTLEKDGSNIENIPYLETNNYVRKILRDYEVYKNINKEEK